jgi:WD40 repeat protein/serine/threonine protein kinase
MSEPLACDEELVRRLPLPLAQLYRRAHNAKTDLERHLTAFYLWEAALKLLGATAIVTYAERGRHDPQLAERLQNLARPALGHWWEFVRGLVPALADQGEGPFVKVRDLLLGRARDDLPRAAGLDGLLREALEGTGGARATVRLTELFDRLVAYRNKELGHGAAGQRPGAFYDRMGRALLVGVAEILGRLDTLAGGGLVHVPDVRRQPSGAWLVERFELTGEKGRRVESLEVSEADIARLPRPGRLYLEPREAAAAGPGPAAVSLHPLLAYEPDTEEVLFLSARRGRRRTEYLCYTTGRTVDRPDLGGEQRQLLAQVLGLAVEGDQFERWAEHSRAEEPAEEVVEKQPLRQLGGFTLLSELGRGGMGVVYRAWQPSLGRQVALKCMLRAGDAKAEARFQREIRALGRVEHPHVVKIFTSGAEGDQWFYAMELVEGATLAAVTEKLQTSTASAADVNLQTWQDSLRTVWEASRQAERPLSDPGAAPAAPPGGPAAAAALPPPSGRSYPRHVVGLVLQVVEAAGALHEAGVVHRDIKPGNIMVSADGTQAALMDLGLAQLVDESEGRLTRSRQFVGTLRYASPEQVLAVGTLDRRSDVYSLGATLWELLTLRPLYEATEQTPTPELMRRIQFQEPQGVRRYNPAVPRDLEAVVLKCLEKDAGRRYAGAGELADDLRRFLGGEPVRARPVGQAERAWRWCRRNPVVAGLLAAFVLALLGGSVAATAFAVAANARAREADEARSKADLARLDEAAAKKRAEEAKRQAEQRREEALKLTYFSSLGQALLLLHARQPNLDLAERTLDRCPPVFRHWEWYFLKRFLQKDRLDRTLDGHTCLAYSRDGKQLATAGAPGVILVWDPQTGRQLRALKGDQAEVRALAFSPDGRRLASAGWGGEDGKGAGVEVWNVAAERKRLDFREHKVAVRAVVYSADGKRLASAAGDGSVKVWDADRGTVIYSWRQRHAVTCLALSPDGRFLAAGGEDGVRVWDAAGKDVPWYMTLPTGVRVTGLAFSPDSKRLARASDDAAVRIWDVTRQRELLTLKPKGVVHGLAFSSDAEGRRLALAGDPVSIWDVAPGPATGQELLYLPESALAVAFSPDDHRLATVGERGKLVKALKLWDGSPGPEFLTLHGEYANAALSPDGKFVSTGDYNGLVTTWDIQTGQAVFTLDGHTLPVRRLAYSPDGSHLASAGEDRSVRLWESATGKPLRKFDLDGAATSVAFSRPDGRWLAAGQQGRPGLVTVWDLAEEGRPVRLPPGHRDTVNDVAFGPDGRLASAGEDGAVILWDVARGTRLLTLTHAGPVEGVALGPDGGLLAATEGKRVRLWDTRTGGEKAGSQPSAAADLHAVAFSPDGPYLAFAGEGKVVSLWQPKARLPFTLGGHAGAVRGVTFSGGGRWLASVGDDQTVRVWAWPLPP